MGRSGIAFSFVNKDQGYMLTEIEQRINRMLEKDPLSEAVGKRRASPAASEGSASEVSGSRWIDSRSAAGPTDRQSEPQADLPFGTAPASRTLGRAKSRGSVRRR
jgi:superfamily II DNA/RNA helicase